MEMQAIRTFSSASMQPVQKIGMIQRTRPVVTSIIRVSSFHLVAQRFEGTEASNWLSGSCSALKDRTSSIINGLSVECSTRTMHQFSISGGDKAQNLNLILWSLFFLEPKIISYGKPSRRRNCRQTSDRGRFCNTARKRCPKTRYFTMAFATQKLR